MKLLKEVLFIASTTQVRDVVRKKNGIMWEESYLISVADGVRVNFFLPV